MKKDEVITFPNAKDEIYYNIGKFVVEFENMIQVLFETMVDFIDKQATFLDSDYIESLMCELETMSLVTKFFNIYGIKYETDRANMGLIKKINQRLKCIIEFRNALVHSSWTFRADESYIPEFKKMFGNVRILEEGLTSIKARKRATKHSEYLKTIDLTMIKEYIKQIINMKSILLKLQKYSANERTIIINSRNLKLLTKEIERVNAEDLREFSKKIATDYKAQMSKGE